MAGVGVAGAACAATRVADTLVTTMTALAAIDRRTVRQSVTFDLAFPQSRTRLGGNVSELGQDPAHLCGPGAGAPEPKIKISVHRIQPIVHPTLVRIGLDHAVRRA